MFNQLSVNKQWSSRPAEERFVSMQELHAANVASEQGARSLVLPSRHLRAVPVDGDASHQGLAIMGPNGHQVAPSHWAFGQLCARVEAPAAYIRSLPAPMAADCLNWGLERTPSQELGVYLQRQDGAVVMSAATGPNYGRVHNSTISGAILRGVDLTKWRVPGEFGKRVEITKQNTTLYRSDSDMFLCLVDEDNRVEIPNRRDGKAGSLARGVMIYNSTVGKMKLGVCTFLFDFMCSNRTIWGGQDFQEISFRHTSGAPDKWLHEVQPALKAYSESRASDITKAIEAARDADIPDVAEFLSKRFTKRDAAGIIAAHQKEEGRPIETLWDASTAITAFARELPYQDERTALERKAGEIMALAA